MTLARGFTFTSYGNSDLVGNHVSRQLDILKKQVPGTTHVTLAVHLRTPAFNSNEVSLCSISEHPAHLIPWCDLARSKDLTPWLTIIMFARQWGWTGYWNPQDPEIALRNYHEAIRPYILAAKQAEIGRVVLVDEWSRLFSRESAISAFQELYLKARDDYNDSGRLSIAVSGYEEADILTPIVEFIDDVQISAYVASATTNRPTVESMRENLLGTSKVKIVRDMVTEWNRKWKDPKVVGYMSFLRHLAEKIWRREVILATGYKSTVGAAKEPSAQPETGPDNIIQARAWQAFIEAALDPERGVGDTLDGIMCWRWWPSNHDDDGKTGYSPQDKPAAAAIANAWKDQLDAPAP